MSGVELVLAFLAGVVMGGALDRFVLPLLVDAWIDQTDRGAQEVAEDFEAHAGVRTNAGARAHRSLGRSKNRAC